MVDYKVVVFGSGGVGKSALTIQFVHGYFITDYDPTIEDSYKRVLLVDGDNVQLDILDTAGQEDFAPMRTSYMRQGKGFIIVYAVDDRASFEEAEEFYNDLIRTKGSTNVPIVICGNKCDLEDKRVISKVEGEEFTNRLNALFYETSALSNMNIEEAFVSLVRKIKQSFMSKEEQKDQTKPKKHKKKLRCNIL